MEVAVQSAERHSSPRDRTARRIQPRYHRQQQHQDEQRGAMMASTCGRWLAPGAHPSKHGVVESAACSSSQGGPEAASTRRLWIQPRIGGRWGMAVVSRRCAHSSSGSDSSSDEPRYLPPAAASRMSRRRMMMASTRGQMARSERTRASTAWCRSAAAAARVVPRQHRQAGCGSRCEGGRIGMWKWRWCRQSGMSSSGSDSSSDEPRYHRQQQHLR